MSLFIALHSVCGLMGSVWRSVLRSVRCLWSVLRYGFFPFVISFSVPLGVTCFVYWFGFGFSVDWHSYKVNLVKWLVSIYERKMAKLEGSNKNISSEKYINNNNNNNILFIYPLNYLISHMYRFEKRGYCMATRNNHWVKDARLSVYKLTMLVTMLGN